MNDDFLLATLRKVFEIVIEGSRPEARQDVDDQVIGQNYRAYETAKKLLAHTFLELEQYKAGKRDDEKFNNES